MSMKFSKFKIPNINLVDQQGEEFSNSKKLGYSFEDEIDLINMEMPKVSN